MTGAFLSELLKLRRRGLLLGGGGLLLGFTAFFTVLGIENATKTPGTGAAFTSRSPSSPSPTGSCTASRARER